MPVSVLKNSAESSVVNRALRIGFAQNDDLKSEGSTTVKLNDAQQKTVMRIANMLGLSVQSVLNAGILYTLYYIRHRKIRPEELKEYPKRLSGRTVPLELTVETSAQIREAKAESTVGACLVAGIKLLASRLFD
jgi:hypothetical protein